MKTFKHLFTALLLLCTTMATAHNFEVGGIYYDITDATNKTVAVTYRGTFSNNYSNEYTGSVVIPESVTYNGTTYNVTRIRDAAFSDCTGLTSIVIPNRVTSIANGAFSGCTGLTSIEIPNSVTSIGSSVFYGCTGLTSVVIGNSVTSIESHAFYNCTGLTNITIPNSVTSIGYYAFSGCTGLTNITIPNSVTSIGYYAFKGCTGLTSVEFNAENCTIIGSYLESVFEDCTALSTITIGENVKKIPDYAFSSCYGLTSITIPNSVTSIGYEAFRGCYRLTSIEIPNSVTSIGNLAFCGCSGLTSIEIPNSVTSIGNQAFEGCTRLKSVVIPNSVTSIGAWAFGYCTGLTSIEIPNSVTSIGGGAFYNCAGLTSVTIPNSVTSIGGSAFEGTAWYNNQPDGVVYAGKVLYRYKGTMPSNTSIVIKEGTLGIAGGAFYNCTGLTSITIPNSVTSIEYRAFYGCTGLTSITIPNSVTNIGDGAFENCTGLKTVINFSNLTFSKGSEGCGYVAYYATKVINAPNAVIDGDFIWCNLNGANTLACYLGEVAELTLPADYNGENYVIGNDAFNGCTGLASVVIPSSVTNIGEDAFMGCTGLKTIYNFSNLTFSKGSSEYGYVANYADKVYNAPNGFIDGDFIWYENEDGMTLAGYLSNATELAMPTDYNGKSVTSIGNSAFYGCTGLTSITIPNSVTSIGNYAFYDCTGLKTVYNFSNLTFSKGSGSYGYVAYYADKVYNAPNGSIDGDFIWYENEDGMTLAGYLGNTTELALPADYNGKSVTSIGDYAFSGCTGLTSITIPNSVTSIEDYAFNGCTSLKELRIEDGESTLSLGYNKSSYSGSNGLFYDCPLETLYLGRNLSYNTNSSYGSSPFCNIKTLASVTIGNSVTSIGSSAFYGCSGLTGITIPNSVTSIGDRAFNGCTGLTSITIPNSVTSIGTSAFEGCTGLKEVHVNNLAAWCKIDFNGAYANPLYNAKTMYLNGNLVDELIIPDGVSSIKRFTFYNCATITSVTLPNSIESFEKSAFCGCTGLTSVEIPNSVTNIGDHAFNGCSGLTSIVIPNSVTSIGTSAFMGCTGLKEVHVNNLAAWCKIDFNGAYANPLYNAKTVYLNGNLVDELIIPDGVSSIKRFTFYNCATITSVTLPNSIESFEKSAFCGCTGLTSVEIPNSVTSIGDYAFYKCSGLTSVVIPNSVTSIGTSAYEDCTNLKNVYNFSNLTFGKGEYTNGYIAYYADKVYNAPNGSMEGDFIFGKPNDVNTLVGYLGNDAEPTLPADYNGENYVIGNDAFNGCTGLASVVIPSSVTNIGEDAFMGCTGLKTVYNFSNLTFGKGENTNGYVAYYADKVYNAPNGSMEGDFIFGKPNDVNTLLYYLGNTANLVLPADYKGENYVIDSAVFKDNTVITSVTIPNSVTSVGDDAFTGCTNVEKLYLDCAEVSDWFCGVSAMKEVTIGNGVTSVVASAFNGCTGLEKVCINDLDAWCGIDFGSADANPLYYAGNLYLNGKLLTDISIPTEVEKVKDYAFYNCNGVTNIDIVDGVKSIGNSAFYGCDDLETLYISNTIESIGDYAFAECNNILDIKIGSKKAITASENIFSSDAYNNAYLYVPAGRRDFYAKTSPWSNFIIKEMDFTGIEDVEAEGERVKDVYYDLSGRVVENPANGIYILNGKKVIVK